MPAGSANAPRPLTHQRAHSRTKRAVRELDTAIAVGDRSSRRLRHRLDDYGTQLDAVRSRLRHEGYLTH